MSFWNFLFGVSLTLNVFLGILLIVNIKIINSALPRKILN